MQTIRTTIENGEISLQDPLTHLSGSFPALIVIDGSTSTIIQVPEIERDHKVLHAEEEFEKKSESAISSETPSMSESIGKLFLVKNYETLSHRRRRPLKFPLY